MNDHYQRFLQAGQTFATEQAKQNDVIGILLAGAWLNGQIDPHSDIDVVIILDPACDYRERGNTWIDGVEIEYFKNPPQQIRSYFKKEINSPHTAHMLANGHLAYQASPLIQTLQEEARAVLANGPAALSDVESDLARYFLDDLWKDLQDAWHHDDILGATLLRDKIINRSIDLYYRFHGTYRVKDKRLRRDLNKTSHGRALQLLLQNCQGPNWMSNDSVAALLEEMATYTDGLRPKEWTLISKLDL